MTTVYLPSDAPVPELTADERAHVAALGFVPTGPWVARSEVDPEVRAEASGPRAELLDRIAKGNPVEVWASADRLALLDASRFFADPAWTMVSILADGTLVKTAVHSSRDELESSGLISFPEAGYDRETLVGVTVDVLVARHRERLAAIARARGSRPCTLAGQDYGRLNQRALDVLARGGVVAIGSAFVLLYGVWPVMGIGLATVAWLVGAGWLPAALLGLVAFLAWQLTLRVPRVDRRLAQRIGSRLPLRRIPARDVLGRGP